MDPQELNNLREKVKYEIFLCSKHIEGAAKDMIDEQTDIDKLSLALAIASGLRTMLDGLAAAKASKKRREQEKNDKQEQVPKDV
jgi:hypothetical protein